MKAKAEVYVKAYGHEWRKIELEDKWMNMDVVWVEASARLIAMTC